MTNMSDGGGAELPSGAAAGAESAVALEALGVAVSAGVPVVLWGSPGTGKTSAVVALAEALGWPVEVVIGSIREPSDFAGLPVVDGGTVRLAAPAWAQRLAEAQHGLLFLDELTTAPPAVQAAMLRIVLERVVGDIQLPPQVRVVAAANPPGEAADGWDLAPPLANRLVHLDWTIDAKQVAQGMAAGFPQPSFLLPEGPPDPTYRSVAKSAVAGFLQARPELVLQVPTSVTAASRGWPSPRSWESVATLLGACEAAKAPPEVLETLVVGAVGEGPGIEFLSWLADSDLPAPEAVLEAPGEFVLPSRSDRAFAVLTAVVSLAVARGDEESWSAAWIVVGRAAEAAPDVAALVARKLARHRPEGAALPVQITQLLPVLRAAGLL
ncbi:AAA family ATPase [Streptomyces sp. NPDC050759]|uniref:AAA family ATPase n=1 Tax=Streptomyces sp. NPDC050759 TaxID=3365635 RepID=UPI00378D2784